MAKRQNDKQRSTKHYTENQRLSNTNPSKTPGGGVNSGTHGLLYYIFFHLGRK